MVLVLLVLGGGGAASTARAESVVDVGILTLAELEGGASFDSSGGAFRFSDFEFTAVGFADSDFEQFLAQPLAGGFRLILGWAPVGPGELSMSYRVSLNGPGEIDSASIPRIAVLPETGAPVADVDWSASNGGAMTGSADDFWSFPGVSVSFAPVASLLVSQQITLQGGSAVVKVENLFGPTQELPEPTSGLLVASGVAAAVALRRRPGRSALR